MCMCNDIIIKLLLNFILIEKDIGKCELFVGKLLY